jgi:hypothetical protein
VLRPAPPRLIRRIESSPTGEDTTNMSKIIETRQRCASCKIQLVRIAVRVDR